MPKYVKQPKAKVPKLLNQITQKITLRQILKLKQCEILNDLLLKLVCCSKRKHHLYIVTCEM